MEKYLVKIEKKDIELPYYREVKTKPLSLLCSDSELPDAIETMEEYVYRMERIKTHQDKLVGLYVDDQSFKVIEDIMDLTNENIKIIVNNKLRKIRKEFQLKYDMQDKDREEILDEIRESKWYERLFKMF